MYYNSKKNNPILNEIRNSLVDKAVSLEGIADIVEWLTECIISSIKQCLEEKKRDFDLEGCELTDEDAKDTIGLILKGYSVEDAVETILNGIYNTLNED